MYPVLYPLIRLPIEIGPKCQIKNQTIVLDKYQIISLLSTLTIPIRIIKITKNLLIYYRIIIGFLTILVIISTGLEIYQKRIKPKNSENFETKSTKTNNLLLSFSILRNTRSLFEPNTRFAALDTIRLLLIINVHIAHYYSFTTLLGVMSLRKIYSEIVPRIFSYKRYILIRTPLMVEALFTLRFVLVRIHRIERINFFPKFSGFLLSYGLLEKLEKNSGRFNFVSLLFQRWLTFLIPMFGSILFYYLLPLFGEGPIWDIGVNWILPACRNTSALLQNLFFINNFSEQEFDSSFLRVSYYFINISSTLMIMKIEITRKKSKNFQNFQRIHY